MSRTLTANARSRKNAHFPHPARASERTQLKIDATEAGDTWGGTEPINTSAGPLLTLHPIDNVRATAGSFVIQNHLLFMGLAITNRK